MNKYVTITLSVLITICIAGIIYLIIQNNSKSDQIDALSNEVKEVLSKSEADKADINSKLAEAQTEISEKDTKIEQLETDKSKLQKEKNELTKIVNSVYCETKITANDIKDITTNLGLVGLLTRTMEKDYNMNSIDTNFDVVWNNSKSAIFDIIGMEGDDKFSYQAVVSWDFDVSRINAIFDIGQGCYYYSR